MRIRIDAPQSALIDTIVGILATRLRERGGPSVEKVDGDAELILALQPGIGAEGFRIEGAAGGTRLAGNDERGLLYGVGKWLRTCRYAGGFSPSAWRGVSVPAKPIRGIYFATHFHNFYHDAPVAEVERYVEDLALWGYNNLAVWLDLHHYTGIDDPAAQAMIARLHLILNAGARVGMGLALTTLTNEGYATTPDHLKATDTHRGFYGVEVCPATPEGEALILRNHRDRLQAFADLPITMIWQWPYDQGGCECDACRPWGANGMLRMAEKLSRDAQSVFPGVKTLYATWLFDYFGDVGEWSGLARACAPAPDWLHYLMADSHTEFPQFPLREGVPGGLPMLNFPEISMWGMWPWGGFGANPLPARFARLWGTAAHALAGGFPYSEGIFEDVNMILYAGFYWTGATDTTETLAEYARYELGCAEADVVEDICAALEANHGPAITTGSKPEGFLPSGEIVALADRPDAWRYLPDTFDAARAGETLARCRALDAALPAWARAGWRWRLLYLRALLDRELSARAAISPAAEVALDELVRLYHAEGAEAVVLPPAKTTDGADMI